MRVLTWLLVIIDLVISLVEKNKLCVRNYIVMRIVSGPSPIYQACKCPNLLISLSLIRLHSLFLRVMNSIACSSSLLYVGFME